ncbi:MAG: deoxyribodipyrimidine photolyase, partial [Gammaproteobacteria bacterium]|nr:deoxyribodipyrimidine photolyase [Gammaproteobacteria bacterium]
MIGARRTRWNFGLQRAAELSLEHRLPLLVLEPLRAGYPWASDRLHRFVIDGMVDNKARFAERGVAYYPYVEPRDGAGKGLLEALAEHAAVIVTDDFPAFFLPRMVNAAAHRISVRVEAIDSNGLLPLRASDGPFTTAYAFRRFLQRALPAHLERLPHPDPLDILGTSAEAEVPTDILDRWPAADLSDPAPLIARIAIDHSVPAVNLRGGSQAAAARLSAFVEGALDRYATHTNHTERGATSRLSPNHHLGHTSTHEVFDRIAAHEGWTSARLSRDARGSRAGWWGMSESAEAFLDQFVTWRELGFVRCLHVDRYDTYEALPEWARKTLAEHASDARQAVYG